MLIPVSYVLVVIGLIAMAVSVPLILRRVPMNRVYGIRVRKAFASERNWYEINAYGGKVFLVFGAFLVIVGLAGRSFAPDPTSLWAPVFLVVPLLALVPALVLIAAFVRRLPG
jgi:hypothetical protein